MESASSLFLSTPSARRATWSSWARNALNWDFYPRPPRGGRPSGSQHQGLCPPFLSTPSARRATPDGPQGQRQAGISIHALREEGDPVRRTPSLRQGHFYPRPPRGGRQRRGSSPGVFIMISIHALREEGDAVSSSKRPAARYFYPRPPRGGRRGDTGGLKLLNVFLSTPSARRATRPGRGQDP